MKRNYFLVALIILIFFVISFLTNIIGPLVPEVIQDFDINLTLAGLLPFAFFIAYGVMSIPSGILVERYREKKVMVWAFFISFLGALLFASTPGYLIYTISLFLIGTGMAMLQVAINPLLRVAGGEENFAFNSVIGQLFFGAASYLSPLAYSYLVFNLESGQTQTGLLALLERIVPENLPWISLYWLFAAVSLLMVLVLTMVKIPRVERKADELVGALETHKELLKKPIVLMFFLGIFAYVGSEQGVANWISEYLYSYHGYDPKTTGAETVSWFWGLLTIGTVLGLILLKFIDSKKILIGFTLGAAICLTLALTGSGPVAKICFPLVGFFLSVMWSIIIDLGLNSMSEHHGTLSGILVSGIAGGAIIPLIIGSLGDIFGLKTGMLFIYIPLGYMMSVGFWAQPLIKNKTISLKRKTPPQA